MTKIITTRVDLKTSTRIQSAVQKSHTEKSVLLRVLITKGLDEFEQKDAITRYNHGQISLGKLADELNITKWDALDLVQKNNLQLAYSEEDLKEDMT